MKNRLVGVVAWAEPYLASMSDTVGSFPSTVRTQNRKHLRLFLKYNRQPQCYYRKLAQLLRTARSHHSTSRVLPLFPAFLNCRRDNPSTLILSCSSSLTQKLSVALKDVLSHSCWASFSFLSQPKALTSGVTWTLASPSLLTLDLADELVPLGQELLILSYSES